METDNVRKILRLNKIEIYDTKNAKQILTSNAPDKEQEFWDNRGFRLLPDMQLQTEFFEKIQKSISLTFAEFSRMGLIIISFSIRPEQRWHNKQSVAYAIVKRDMELPPSVNILNAVPEGSRLLFDPINKRIRGWGQNFGPTGYSQWINLND